MWACACSTTCPKRAAKWIDWRITLRTFRKPCTSVVEHVLTGSTDVCVCCVLFTPATVARLMSKLCPILTMRPTRQCHCRCTWICGWCLAARTLCSGVLNRNCRSYYEAPPGLQLLHFIQTDCRGGANEFGLAAAPYSSLTGDVRTNAVDMFAAVEALRTSNRAAFDVLSTVKFSFHFRDNENWMYYR